MLFSVAAEERGIDLEMCDLLVPSIMSESEMTSPNSASYTFKSHSVMQSVVISFSTII